MKARTDIHRILWAVLILWVGGCRTTDTHGIRMAPDTAVAGHTIEWAEGAVQPWPGLECTLAALDGQIAAHWPDDMDLRQYVVRVVPYGTRPQGAYPLGPIAFPTASLDTESPLGLGIGRTDVIVVRQLVEGWPGASSTAPLLPAWRSSLIFETVARSIARKQGTWTYTGEPPEPWATIHKDIERDVEATCGLVPVSVPAVYP